MSESEKEFLEQVEYALATEDYEYLYSLTINENYNDENPLEEIPF